MGRLKFRIDDGALEALRFAALIMLLLSMTVGGAWAQQPVLPGYQVCSTASGSTQCSFQPVSVASPLPVNASVSASIAGFTPGLTFATLTATGSSASVALPAGDVVAFTNTGTTTVSCTLGVGAATALVGEVQVFASSTTFLTVGSNTFGACIDESGSASNVVRLAGGTGLGTGFGSGGGSGGGAATIADGADVAEGATADAAATAGSAGTVSAKMRLMTTQLGAIATSVASATPAGTALIGKVGVDQTTPGTTNGVAIVGVNAATALAGNGVTGTGSQRVTIASDNTAFSVNAIQSGTWNIGSVTTLPALVAGTARVGYTSDDPCTQKAKTNLPISQSGTSSVQLVALSGATVIYVCSLSLVAAGATTVALTTGTGSACVTGNAAVLGTTTASIANSLSLAANGGLTLGNGGGTIMAGAASSELCMVLGTNVFVSGNLTYVQQ